MRLDPIITAIIIISLLIVGGVAAASRKTAAPAAPASQFSATDANRPEIAVSENNFSFGRMAASETKDKDIIITNRGQSPLVLTNFKTSCDCTSIELIYNGEASPRFSMHTNSSWQADIAPAASAIVRITYQPSIMPVSGRVERSAFFQTNDPVNANITVSFTAEVE